MEAEKEDNKYIYELKQVLRGDGSTYEFYELKRHDEMNEDPNPKVIGKHVYGELYFNEA